MWSVAINSSPWYYLCPLIEVDIEHCETGAEFKYLNSINK